MRTLRRVAAPSLLFLGIGSLPAAGDEAERAFQAAEIVESILLSPDGEIPEELFERAYAVAVVPNLVKGAFLFGGRYGKGLVSSRGADGEWSDPAFIQIGGGSFGLQIGVEVTDLILVFTKEDGIVEMLEDHLKLGAAAGAVAGPVGRHVEAGTNVTFDSPIYAYSRAKGLFAGVAIEGSVVTVDDSANEKLYGEGVTARDLLLERRRHSVEATKPFLDALVRHVPRKSS